jgi:hypothetical protein
MKISFILVEGPQVGVHNIEHNATQHNDTQHNNIQHNYTHHKGLFLTFNIDDSQYKRNSA